MRINFPVPAGCRLGLTWFQTIGGPFPGIALVRDEDVLAGATEAANAMEQAMDEFNRAVNWRALSVLLDGRNLVSVK